MAAENFMDARKFFFKENEVETSQASTAVGIGECVSLPSRLVKNAITDIIAIINSRSAVISERSYDTFPKWAYIV